MPELTLCVDRLPRVRVTPVNNDVWSLTRTVTPGPNWQWVTRAPDWQWHFDPGSPPTPPGGHIYQVVRYAGGARGQVIASLFDGFVDGLPRTLQGPRCLATLGIDTGLPIFALSMFYVGPGERLDRLESLADLLGTVADIPRARAQYIRDQLTSRERKRAIPFGHDVDDGER